MTNPSTALDRRTPGRGMLEFDDAVRYATFAAKSELVPKALKDNPNGVMLVGLLGQELGVPFISALSEIHVIENRPSPSAQLRLALIRRAGHEARFLESSETKAVIRARRAENRNDPDGWVTVEWTIEQARKAGLVDRWVERWVTKQGDDNRKRNVKETFVVGDDTGIFDEAARRSRGLPVAIPEWAQALLDAGETKGKDNWLRYTAEMLRARCSSAICRMEFSDVLLGMEGGDLDLFTVEERGHDVGQDVDDVARDEDEDVVDGELVDDDEAAKQAQGDDGAADEAMTAAATLAEEVPGQNNPGDAAPEPSANEQGQGDEGSPVAAEPDGSAPPSPEDGLLTAKQRADFAIACATAGITDEQRHEMIHMSTAGRVRSLKQLRTDELPTLFRWFENVVEGAYRFVTLPDGCEVLAPRSPEGDAGDETLFRETA